MTEKLSRPITFVCRRDDRTGYCWGTLKDRGVAPEMGRDFPHRPSKMVAVAWAAALDRYEDYVETNRTLSELLADPDGIETDTLIHAREGRPDAEPALAP